MKTEPIRAARNAPALGSFPAHSTAAAVPTSTGAMAAGNVRGRAAITQILMRWLRPSRPPREFREVRCSLVLEGLTALGRLLAAVEEQVGVVGELLDPGVTILMRVEAGLDQAQGEGGEGEHLAAAGNRLRLEPVERHHLVDQAHLARLLGVVLAAEQPELLRLLGADEVAQQRGAEAAIPGADPRSGLAEPSIVGGDRHVAADVQDVAAADRVAGDHRHHGLRQSPHLHLQVGDVKATERSALLDVAGVAADLLIAAGAKRLGSLAGEDDHADAGVLAGQLERRGALDQRLRPDGVEDLGPVDRDLGDPVVDLVVDVVVLTFAPPLDRGVERFVRRCFLVAFGHDGHDIPPMKLDDWLAQRSQSCPERTALVADGSEVTYAELEAEATWVARRR